MLAPLDLVQFEGTETQNDVIDSSQKPLGLSLTTGAADSCLVGGAAIGVATSIALWQGVQIAGVASTGTAMLGLHGAAATNAGWAAFGGGSLAAGGGGMALGHLILPGIGVAVGVGYAAYKTHTDADELNAFAEKVSEANRANNLALASTKDVENRIATFASRYHVDEKALLLRISSARRTLRRFGYLSVLWRYMRLNLFGYFYTEDECGVAYELEDAVRQFLATYGNEPAST